MLKWLKEEERPNFLIVTLEREVLVMSIWMLQFQQG